MELFTIRALASTTVAALLALGTFAQSNDNDEDRKVSIDITIKENGEKQRIKKDLELKEGQTIEDALRELGVLEELGELEEAERLEIDIRRRSEEDMLRDMHMSMFWNEDDECEEGEERAFLGVYLEDGTSGNGVNISDIIEGTAAEKAGLKKNDVIIAVDGSDVSTVKELVDELDSKEPGEEVKLAYLRDGKKQQMKVELGTKKRKKHRVHRFSNGNSWLGNDGDNDVFVFAPNASRAFLGVEGSTTDRGVELDHVIEGTAAEEMGLKEGDVVTAINSKETATFEDLAKIINDLEPEDGLTVDLLRDDVSMTLTGNVGERAAMHWGRHYDIAYPDNMHVIEIPELPELPEFPEFDDMFTDEDREMLRKEMDELREELRELRDELRGEIKREMHISITRTRLSDEEKALLEKNGVSGLDRALKLEDLRCSPNPSNGMFELSFTPVKEGDLSVEVFNTKGERLRQEKLSGLNEPYRGSLDLTEQGNGTYFLVITQNGRTFTEKLVKQ